MKINPSSVQIDIKAISKQTAATNSAAQRANKATAAFQQAPKSQKTKAGMQMTEAMKSAESSKRSGINQRLNSVKNTTAQLNQKTAENGKAANIMMAKAISPKGAMSTEQLGRFIDRYS